MGRRRQRTGVAPSRLCTRLGTHLSGTFATRRTTRVSGTFHITHRTRGTRLECSNRPCVVRPVTISGVLLSLNVSTRSMRTTLLRSAIRSASVALSCVGRRFNSSITTLMSNIAGLNGIPLSGHRRRRTRGVEGVLLTVSRSVEIVVVGLTSEVRGVHALDFEIPRGQHSATLRALRVCTPVTRHLNVEPTGRRLRSLSVHFLSPVTCGRVRRGLGELDGSHLSFLRSVRNGVHRQVANIMGSPAVRNEVGDMRNVCHGVCVRGGGFTRVCSICTVHVVISDIVSYCGYLNMVRSVFEPLPNEFGSCVSAPGPGVCRSLRAAIVNGRNVPFRIRVEA